MSNVVQLHQIRASQLRDPKSALLAGFAQQRRVAEDVFWLKENAELLGILNVTDAQVTPQALAPFETFYERLEERFSFFPQYYRFLLSICLDLEDLGMTGNKGARLCAAAAKAGLAEAELSDLQRGEARRLLARRGAARPVHEGALGARLHRFIERSQTFALPNKKAAYELTHIVFYLSDYGQRDPDLSKAAVTSLHYAGLLAYLEQNMDLLAEVCVALRFAGQRPSAIWEDAVALAHQRTEMVTDGDGPLNDGYHAYLVTGWSAAVAGGRAFDAAVPEGAVRFLQPLQPGEGVLRALSGSLLDMGAARSGSWHDMRPMVAPILGQMGHDVLAQAEASSDLFDQFFERFSRAAMV